MQLPADMRVNGEDFMHLSVREGATELHLALLDFYARSFDLERVALRDESSRLPRGAVANLLAGPSARGLEAVLLIREDGSVEDLRARGD